MMNDRFWKGFDKQASKLNFRSLEKIRKGFKLKIKGFSGKSIKSTRAGRSVK